jgi:hypothetical protein
VLGASTAQNQRVGNVVDVFGRAGEMHEWAEPHKLGA